MSKHHKSKRVPARKQVAHKRSSKPLTLYHFTNLLSLDCILKEGIQLGEVPIQVLEFHQRPQAPNLTSNPCPIAQDCWVRGSSTDKTRIRLTVSIPVENVESFECIRRKKGMNRRWVKTLAPNEEHRDWYFALGGIPSEQIRSVELDLDQDGKYRTLEETEIAELAEMISVEKRRIGYMPNGRLAFVESQISFLFDAKTPPPQGSRQIVPSLNLGLCLRQRMKINGSFNRITCHCDGHDPSSDLRRGRLRGVAESE